MAGGKKQFSYTYDTQQESELILIFKRHDKTLMYFFTSQL